MQLTFNVKDRPKLGQTLIFALQQLLAILAATIAVPNSCGQRNVTVGGAFSAPVSALLFICFLKIPQSVFLGSSFKLMPSMFAAFGRRFQCRQVISLGNRRGNGGSCICVIAIIVKFAGVKWVSKLIPAVVIGPTSQS